MARHDERTQDDTAGMTGTGLRTDDPDTAGVDEYRDDRPADDERSPAQADDERSADTADIDTARTDTGEETAHPNGHTYDNTAHDNTAYDNTVDDSAYDNDNTANGAVRTDDDTEHDAHAEHLQDAKDTEDTGHTWDVDAEPVPAAEQDAPRLDADIDEARPLFGSEEVDRFRTEWQQVQTMFVDDPREAVQSADHLVSAVMQALTSIYDEHRQELEGRWREGTDVQTEDLRIALRRYRSFFNQLLDA